MVTAWLSVKVPTTSLTASISDMLVRKVGTMCTGSNIKVDLLFHLVGDHQADMDTTTNTSIIARCGGKNDEVYHWECKLTFIHTYF